jgi:MFS family permease
VKAAGPRAARPLPLPPPPAPPTGLARSLRGALAGNFALRFAGAATGILLTRYLASSNDTGRPIGAGVVALLTAGFYATELVGSPLLGAVGDRRGWRALLLLGPLLGALALGLTAATTLLVVLLLARLLEGLSAAAAVPAILGHLGETTDGDDALRGRALSVFEATTALGTLVGVAAAAGLWLVWGRGAFLVVAAIYLVAAGCFVPVRDARALRVTRPWRLSLAALRGQRRLIAFLPGWLGLGAITGLWFSHGLYQIQVRRPEGAGQLLAGSVAGDDALLFGILLVYALTFSLGALLWGYFGLRHGGEVAVMRIALAAMFGICATLWALNHSGAGTALRAGLVALSLALLLVESGFAPAAVAYLARLSGQVADERGLVMGLYSVVSGGGALLGVAIGAPFAERFALDGVLAATVLLACGALVALWHR